jgi:NAD(P)-dependent dehydrogenase (short-subunit alcohol dehydrogenase family)
MSLKGRVALVTGGGRGIGRAIALGLAHAGALVVISYRSDDDAARQTVADIEHIGGCARSLRAGVDEAEERVALVEYARSELGPISILVNNAGQSTSATDVAHVDFAGAENAIQAHALGPLHLCQLVLPDMRREPRGDIIMISSSAPQLAARNTSVYTMAKSAMESLAFVLAKEEVRHNIRVNIVAPGLVATRMGNAVVRGLMGRDADIHDVDKYAPFGRVCQPEDVAALVTFLVSDAGGYVTGTRIPVDGGSPGWVGPPPASSR